MQDHMEFFEKKLLNKNDFDTELILGHSIKVIKFKLIFENFA